LSCLTWKIGVEDIKNIWTGNNYTRHTLSPQRENYHSIDRFFLFQIKYTQQHDYQRRLNGDIATVSAA